MSPGEFLDLLRGGLVVFDFLLLASIVDDMGPTASVFIRCVSLLFVPKIIPVVLLFSFLNVHN